MAVAATATTLAHQLPPMSIPTMPRIRPPRMLKGDPHPNNAPPPQLSADSPRPRGQWVQGKWRSGGSAAVKHKRETQNVQIAKALRHQTHGLDIYAYRHIRTNQVVYSLTRTLQETKVLKQLLYHGKKTVPATVRNDLWTPYFSIHFPSTPAGALEGLFAFQKLRELSIQRQLSPPDDLIRATQEDIDIIKSKLGSPTTLQEMASKGELRDQIPRLNEILPKKLRAQKLMDHKATSVADAAFVLDWILSGPSPWERVTKVATNRAIAAGEMSSRATRRVAKLRGGIERKASEIRERASMAFGDLSADDRTRLGLTPELIRQLSLEHQSLIKGHRMLKSTDRAIDLDNLDEFMTNDKVKMLPEMDDAAREERTQAIQALKDRQQTVKTAEQNALKEWFENAGDSSDGPNGAMWEQVSSSREDALDTFDTQQRVDKLATTTNEDSEVSTGDKPAWATASRDVHMYWSDMNDGLFAASWPRAVLHGPLAPLGVAKTQHWRMRTTMDRDEQGNVNPHRDENGDVDLKATRQKETYKVERVVSKNVHVMGQGEDEGWVDEEIMLGGKRPVEWVDPPEPKTADDLRMEGEAKAEEEALLLREKESPATEDTDIVFEERPKGVWGRVKGIFGR